jgi:membrane protein YdbS with pleckstrin-like domain
MTRPAWMKRPESMARAEWRTTRIAIGLVVLAAVGLPLWFTVDGLKPWVPNITVGAITVAVTITIIDRAVRREVQDQERRRLQPRVDSALRRLGVGFARMMNTLVMD